MVAKVRKNIETGRRTSGSQVVVHMATIAQNYRGKKFGEILLPIQLLDNELGTSWVVRL